MRDHAPVGEIVASLGGKNDLSSPLVAAGLHAFQTAPSSLSNAEAIQSAELAIERRDRTAHLEAQRSLIPLDTIASVAPFLGMIATIIGILGSFRGNDSKMTGLQSISIEIAISLIPMIVGLAVAVVATWFYGHVSRGIEKLEARCSKLMLTLVAYLNAQSREQLTSTPLDSLPPRTDATKTLHHGMRLLLCALWLWWLLFAIPVSLGIVWGLYSLFAGS